jgi:putative hemolysin
VIVNMESMNGDHLKCRSDKTCVTVEWVQSSCNVGVSHFSPSFNLCGIDCRLLVRESAASPAIHINNNSGVSSPQKSTQQSSSTLGSLSPQVLFRKRGSSSPGPTVQSRLSPIPFITSMLSSSLTSKSKGSSCAHSYVSVCLDFIANSSNLALVKGYTVNLHSVVNEVSPLFPNYQPVVPQPTSTQSQSAQSHSRPQTPTSTATTQTINASSNSHAHTRSPSPSCGAASLFHDGRVFFTPSYIAENCFKSKHGQQTNNSASVYCEGTIGFEVELAVDEENKVIDICLDGWIPDEDHAVRLSHGRRNSRTSSTSSSSSLQQAATASAGRFTPPPLALPSEDGEDFTSTSGGSPYAYGSTGSPYYENPHNRSLLLDDSSNGKSVELAIPIPVVPKKPLFVPNPNTPNSGPNTAAPTPTDGIACSSHTRRNSKSCGGVMSGGCASVSAGAAVGSSSPEYLYGILDEGFVLMGTYLDIPKSYFSFSHPVASRTATPSSSPIPPAVTKILSHSPPPESPMSHANTSPNTCVEDDSEDGENQLQGSANKQSAAGLSEPLVWTHRLNKRHIDVFSTKLSNSCWQVIKAASKLTSVSAQKIVELLINDENVPIIDEMIESVEVCVNALSLYYDPNSDSFACMCVCSPLFVWMTARPFVA